MKKSTTSPKAPAPAKFFSQAILTSSKYKLELSGQIGLDPQTSKLVQGGVTSQTKQTFNNIEAILSEVGWTLDNVTKARVYLTSMSDYQEMNDIYATKFKNTPPARIAVAVKELPLGATVEIECVAEGDKIANKLELEL